MDKLFVFENLKEHDPKTGLELSNFFKQNFKERLLVEYKWVNSKAEFISALESVEKLIEGDEKNIFISLEFHGAEDKIEINCETSQYESVSWMDICPLLRKINIKCLMSLNVLASACYGAYLAKTIHMDNCAPFYRLIGPNGTYDCDRILKANETYIKEILNEESLTISSEENSKYLEIYQKSNFLVKYEFLDAAELFKKVFQRYVSDSLSQRGLLKSLKDAKRTLISCGLISGKGTGYFVDFFVRNKLSTEYSENYFYRKQADFLLIKDGFDYGKIDYSFDDLWDDSLLKVYMQNHEKCLKFFCDNM